MKKIFIIILCICYTMVSIGATFQIHRCGEHMLWSVSSEKLAYEACPLCNHSGEGSTKEDKSCHDEGCKDMEFKFDQLSDKPFFFVKDNGLTLSPAIVVIPWIQEIFSSVVPTKEIVAAIDILAFANSSPPVYLTNCIFRI